MKNVGKISQDDTEDPCSKGTPTDLEEFCYITNGLHQAYTKTFKTNAYDLFGVHTKSKRTSKPSLGQISESHLQKITKQLTQIFVRLIQQLIFKIPVGFFVN